MEYIEEVDWEGNFVALRLAHELKKGMFPHKASLVIPKTEDGKFIISRRSKNKHPYPDTWMCAVGGKVAEGEDYETAAMREMQEETSHQVPLEYVTTFKHKEGYQAIFQVFTTKQPIRIEDLTPNQAEIQYFREVSVEELKEELFKNPQLFAPTFRVAVESFLEVSRL